MTVLLVLFTFIAFLSIDYFMNRGKQPVMQVAPAVRKQVVRPLEPSLVGGFKVPEVLRYHPGHTWALSESPNLVRVGIDDFAGKISGAIEKINLPQRGQWIRQGQKIWSIERNGKKVDMVSPIEGSVAEINDAILTNPTLAAKDPYGEGWLLTVQSPDAKTNFRNLLGGALARWWMEEAAGRLQRRMPMMAGAMAQDGGEAIDNLTSELPNDEWEKVAKEFFLS
jgi:glycine cleavage system H lipoate-binding protein